MANDLMIAAAAGVAAGLGVAMPLGAISAMLMREGLVSGARVGFAAAAGVAAVDAVYCSLAILAGSVFSPAITAHRTTFLLVSGLLLIGIGGRQLAQVRRSRAQNAPMSQPRSAPHAFVGFVALTAVNPLTLVYFLALAGAVTADGASVLVRAVFVVAATLASLAWQLLLAGTGSFVGARASPAVVNGIGVVASLLIIGLGCSIVIGAWL